jgi:glutathione S-transferase
MIKIYGIPISVHVRKTIVTAIAKNIDYAVEAAVIPFIPPRNWASLSPTGLIPVMQDGDFSTAESTSICVYLERKKPAPPILPAGDREYSQAMLFWDGYSGWIFRTFSRGLFFHRIINPQIYKAATDQVLIDELLAQQRPKIFGYLESRIDGKFLAGPALSLADIGVVSNLINYQYLGFTIDPAKYPKLSKYTADTLALEPFREALKRETPFAGQLGLDRTFLL